MIAFVLVPVGHVAAGEPTAAELADWQKRAGQGDVEALRIMAALYASGFGEKKNIDLATQYYLQAAEKGDREACIHLRILEQRGELAKAGVMDAEAENLCRSVASSAEVAGSEEETAKRRYPAIDLQKSRSALINQYSDPETRATMRQMLSRNFGLYPYQANYLLPVSYDFVSKKDRKHAEVKFQLSVMRPIAQGLLGMDENYFLAYTQQSNWQAYAPSAPFRETNYEPEAFVLFAGQRLPVLDAFRLGLNHQSNGQAGELSRSWNRVFAEGLVHYRQALISLKAWYRIPERRKNDNNPDIESWLGNGELVIAWPYKHHFYKLTLRNNLHRESNRGSLQIDWSVPTPVFEDSFFYVQYFNGYGESLIDYNRRVDKLGIGIMWSR